MLSLIFPTQGNPVSVRRTIQSYSSLCSEFVIGSVCLFKEDETAIENYSSEFNIKVVKLPFDFIFKNGFSETLNLLANNATGDFVIYANVGEIIEAKSSVPETLFNGEYNAFYIDHSVEKFRWWRCYNKKELRWSGLLHEELVGEYRPYYKPILRFADTEKDNNDPLKSKCYDDVKELCYFNQLCRIVEDESLLGATSPGWAQFAKEQYESMQTRLRAKGERWEAFKAGDLDRYMNDVMTNPEFERQRFESSLLIEYQNGKRFL
jgi:hypothetical protein